MSHPSYWARAAAGVQLTTVLDPDYPQGLRDVAGRPPLLWHRGTFEARGAGVTVVSGLARGIDNEAHAAALAGGASTLAVLGHDRAVYPPENAGLAEAIAGHGALILTLHPDTPPSSASFRARNLVIAGLSAGSDVIEAGSCSDARIEARLAASHGRPVPRTLLERETRARGFAASRGAVVIDDAAHVLADVAKRRQPIPPPLTPPSPAGRNSDSTKARRH